MILFIFSRLLNHPRSSATQTTSIFYPKSAPPVKLFLFFHPIPHYCGYLVVVFTASRLYFCSLFFSFCTIMTSPQISLAQFVGHCRALRLTIHVVTLFKIFSGNIFETKSHPRPPLSTLKALFPCLRVPDHHASWYIQRLPRMHPSRIDSRIGRRQRIQLQVELPRNGRQRIARLHHIGRAHIIGRVDCATR